MPCSYQKGRGRSHREGPLYGETIINKLLVGTIFIQPHRRTLYDACKRSIVFSWAALWISADDWPPLALAPPVNPSKPPELQMPCHNEHVETKGQITDRDASTLQEEKDSCIIDCWTEFRTSVNVTEESSATRKSGAKKSPSWSPLW